MKKEKISIIAPMYNEEEIVQEYCEETIKCLEAITDQYDYEILLVNDGSNDRTWIKMNEMHLKYSAKIALVNLTRNFGLEGAIKAGLEVTDGDIVIAMDADLQDPPSIILKMLKKYEDGADVVIANRKKREYDSLVKRWTASVYYKILDSLSGKIKVQNGAGNYRLLSSNAVQKLKGLQEVNGVFRITTSFIGMKTGIVEYEREKRYAGKTKYNLSSMIRYALDSITGISVELLRKVWFMIVFGIIGIVGNIIGFFSAEEMKGAFYVGILLSSFYCFICIGISLIGEYIGQILLEVKHRPTSLIYEYVPIERGK